MVVRRGTQAPPENLPCHPQVTFWRLGPSGASCARTSPPSSATWPSSNATTSITSEDGSCPDWVGAGGCMVALKKKKNPWFSSHSGHLLSELPVCLALSPEAAGSGVALEVLILGLYQLVSVGLQSVPLSTCLHCISTPHCSSLSPALVPTLPPWFHPPWQPVESL